MKQVENRWPLMVAAVLAGVFAAIRLPSAADWSAIFKAIERAWSRPAVAAAAAPKVLLVSRLESDRFSVRATVEPRGYVPVFADSAEAGIAILARERAQIAVVVIDLALPHSKRLLKAVRAHCPHAHLLELHGPRQAGQVSALLINTAIN